MKLESVYDLINDLKLGMIIVCETWIKTAGNFARVREDIEESKGLKINAYNRPGKKVGGGVCIIHDPNKMKLEENKFN